MATLFQYTPHLFSLPSSHHYQQAPISFIFDRSCFHFIPLRHNCNVKHSILCCAFTKKSRKLMSDADLCNSIREFVASVGLPEGHVPSTKQLSEHGRKDLANIVRRRGHKFIKELLANSSQLEIEGSDSENNFRDEQAGIYVEGTGQEEKVNDISELVVDTLLINDGSTGNSFATDYESAASSDDQWDRPGEFSLSLHQKMNDTIEESNDVSLMDDFSATDNRLEPENEPAASSDNQSHISTETSISLQEKVEYFMKYGQLDSVEDYYCSSREIVNEMDGESSTVQKNLFESESVSQSEVDTRHLAYVNSNNTGLNGTPTSSRLAATDSSRDYKPTQETNSDIDKDMNKTVKMENEDELNRLKSMLHHQELELSRLKEEIENEKKALLALQFKAESEISKAQHLISEKDAELHAAEESLSGLFEAKIQYSGEGQMVEVAGSFNGWHQRIKLEPQPSAATLEPIGSRKLKLWSTTLWLYPGVYEIKFIVDGQWKIDPQRESTIKGGIENNILVVE